jgi:hypothetical protein
MAHGKLITALQYFTDIFEDYWHILYPFVPHNERMKDPFLYFYDISRKALDYDGQFNNEGIYLFYGYDGKYHLHALELAQYSLACWLAWKKTNDKNWLTKALMHCDWLVDNQESDGAWRIEHKNPLYTDLPSPWPSSLTQGLAISSLIRAYLFSEDVKYLNSAKHACAFLDIEVSSKGVKREFDKNNIQGFIYEEYPRSELNGVLNGYISSILGIYELALIDSDFMKLAKSNITNLKKILPLFDTGYWSYYALDGNIDSGFYHRYIITQLSSLEELDVGFKCYKIKFEKYGNNRFNQLRAFLNKVIYKL